MKIKSYEGGFDKNLCYLLWCEETKLTCIVDPSVAITPIVEDIEANNLKLDKIFITHTHSDHIFYLDDFIHLFPNVNVLCHEKPISRPKCHISKLSDYEIITLGQEIFVSIHTPGHHKDSICYWNRKQSCLLTGDTIFVGRTGRTIGRHSNIEDLYHSVYSKIFDLPHNTTIYPGHNYGYEKTISIKENIRYSDFFSCSSAEEFKQVMKRFEANRR